MEPVLKVENICKRFGTQTVLDNVSLDVKRGEVYGLLGPNGAGKTTLLRIINQITTPDSGSVFFYGHPLTSADVSRIGYMPEERGLYKGMKVVEQIIYLARLKGMSRRDAISELKIWMERFDIADWRNKSVAELSKGMAQKVQFISTIIHKPDLLIFDEPFSGFDPINSVLLKREIMRLRDLGTTIILSTHDMNSVEEICEKITLLDKSHCIISGSIDDVRRNHCSDVYELRFVGDLSKLEDGLTPMATILHSAQETAGYTIRFRLSNKSMLRSAIATINELVEIRTLSEIIPNMNDIFISSVTQSNNNNE